MHFFQEHQKIDSVSFSILSAFTLNLIASGAFGCFIKIILFRMSNGVQPMESTKKEAGERFIRSSIWL